MKIHNIRLGFATNSSSSHSIIFSPTNIANDDYESSSFGWNFFTLTSKEAKDNYISCMLYENLSSNKGLSKSFIELILNGLNLPIPGADEDGCIDGIDHQSLYTLPIEFGTKSISIDFFNEFRSYLSREGIHILGGNDNTEESHPLFDDKLEVKFPIPLDAYYNSENYICRKDGEWWTIFDSNSGNRVVLSFEDNPVPFKPLTPQLIDLSISDYCTINCQYCYKGSTKNGSHMKSDEVYRIVRDIAKAKVFEVAIGGGEPTQCPELVPMLDGLKREGITVNFTTKSIEWLENEHDANEILPLIGAFAYSATDTKPLDRILTIFNYRGYDTKKFTVQVIPATMRKYQLKTILEWCAEHNIRITLLGFKDTGRGGEYKNIRLTDKYDKFDEDMWMELIKELHSEKVYPIIAIDTTLAARYDDKLHEENIAKYLYHKEEGKYSAYLDAVSMKFGPSSYHPDKLIDYPKYTYEINAIEDLFAQIEPV